MSFKVTVESKIRQTIEASTWQVKRMTLIDSGRARGRGRLKKDFNAFIRKYNPENYFFNVFFTIVFLNKKISVSLISRFLFPIPFFSIKNIII